MVSFIFTNTLDQFGIRKQSEWYGSTPWLRVNLGVVECDLHIHPAEVDSAETFRHPQCFSVGRPGSSNQLLSLKPRVSATNTSPSHFPTEYPNQLGVVSGGRPRPSVKICR